MKHNHLASQQHIEDALTMYKENVSPSETCFQAILSQIPEQQKLKEGRAIRSPYRWLVISQVVTLSAVLVVILPFVFISPKEEINPYNDIDKQIELFEQQINNEDYERTLRDSTL